MPKTDGIFIPKFTPSDHLTAEMFLIAQSIADQVETPLIEVLVADRFDDFNDDNWWMKLAHLGPCAQGSGNRLAVIFKGDKVRWALHTLSCSLQLGDNFKSKEARAA